MKNNGLKVFLIPDINERIVFRNACKIICHASQYIQQREVWHISESYSVLQTKDGAASSLK